MNTDLRSSVLCLKEQQDSFLFLLARIKAILKAKRVWHVLQGENVASSFLSHQDEMERTITAAQGIMAYEYDRDIGCSLILKEHGKDPFLWVMPH